MPSLNTALVLNKIVEVHNTLRFVTSVKEAAQIILPALAESVGFQGAMLKVKDDDGLFRGYITNTEGKVEAAPTPTEPEVYKRFMSKAQRISNSYFVSHEVDVWDSIGMGYTGWDSLPDIPDWEPGKWHPEDALLVPIYDQSGELAGVLWPDNPVNGRLPDERVVQIIEIFAAQAVAAVEIRRLLERTQKVATTDGLTGLHTHRNFQERLEQEVAEALRHSDCLSLLMLDLDRFKKINDTYGHPTGDQVLCHTAEVLRATCRRSDHLSRYGGEEFAVILPRTDLAGAEVQARRIHAAIRDSQLSGLPPVMVSVGVASFPVHAHQKDALIVAADRALLQAKRMGRNCVVVYQPHKKAANA